MTSETIQVDSRSTLHLPDTYAAEAWAMLKLAGPLVLTQVASMAIGTTDLVMVGRLGPAAFASVTLGLSLYYMPMMFGFGMSAALSPLLAQTIGADPNGLNPALRRPDTVNELRTHFRSALWAIVLTTLPAMIIMLSSRQIFGLLGQDPHLADTAAIYLLALIPGLPFALVIGSMRNLFSALSRPRPALFVTVLWIGVNIVLNWIFVFGNLGMPPLGVIGSGVATSCATIFSTLLMVTIIRVHPDTRALDVFRGIWRFEGRRIMRYIWLGLPIGLTLFFEGAVFNTAVWLVGAFGAEQLAGHQIAVNVCSNTFMVPLGISFAATVRVGYAAGARDWHAARRAGHVGMGLAFLFMMVSALVIWTWPIALAGLYLDISSPEAVTAAAFAAKFLGIAAVFQLADGQQVSAAFSLRGLKDTKMPMLIAAFAYWVIGFPLCLLLGFGLHMEGLGIWIGLAIALAVAAVLMTWRFEALTRFNRRG